jgi:hypothetical protein
MVSQWREHTNLADKAEIIALSQMRPSASLNKTQIEFCAKKKLCFSKLTRID